MQIIPLIISYMQTLPVWGVFAVQLLFLWSFMLLMLKFFGKEGIYVYIVVAIVCANIEVLKLVKFPLYNDPITLGNILFSSTFLATDILNEIYGKKAAQKAVWLGFFGYFMSVCVLFIALGFNPLTPAQAGEELAWALPVHGCMEVLFLPAPSILIASMTAYFISQFLDIRIFDKIKTKTRGKHLWLRNNASTFISSAIDNTIFNVLAFMILSQNPVSIGVIFKSYVAGMLFLRWGLAVFDTPFIYISKKITLSEENT